MFVAQLDLGPHAIRQHRSKRIAVNETRELFYAKRLSALTRRKESGSLVTCPARNGFGVFTAVRFSETPQCLNCRKAYDGVDELDPPGKFFVSRAGKAYDARGEFRALSLADYLSRVSADRARAVVAVLELPATVLITG
jgi:hypothetical protein